MRAKEDSMLYNYIFISLLVIAIIAIIVTFSIASEQDKQFKKDYLVYRAYLNEINKNNYGEAEKMIKMLLPRYEDNYNIQWHYGVTLMGLNKYPEAEEHLRRAREIRPALVTQAGYLINYGEVLYKLNDKERATRYLEECIKLNDPNFKPKAKELLQMVKQDGGQQNEDR